MGGELRSFSHRRYWKKFNSYKILIDKRLYEEIHQEIIIWEE
ncbi:MAG: hypothetical protein ACTSQS_13900 [Promethearchaeota archaeon]